MMKENFGIYNHLSLPQFFTLWYTPTLTPHSSVLIVARETVDSEAFCAVSKVAFTTIAVNIVQVNRANTSTKVSIAKGHCICWYRSYNNH